MSDIYLAIVGLLFVLAITDLIVGVSNDAVNFLNSAIGARVASFKWIMVVASAGIFFGAVFSSGMMEVARKSIFYPEQFVFVEIMAIFLAVMLTDVILLDLFNTFGLPTSTTVSIVFELLGAAVVVSMIKMANADIGLSHLGEYINSSTALLIIGGILLSVVVAFAVGSGIQWFSRILFSFNFEKRMKWVGALWSGVALSAMTYFLLIKGIKGASFVDKGHVLWVQENTYFILGLSFLGWSGLMQLLHSVFKVNILKIVVLAGTFALAMAFAGNDLVNFVGVPIAGLESYKAWSASGVAIDEFSMGVLSNKVQTDTWMLLLAGLIMVLSLWFSKKARSVVETSVNLSRQSEGTERFAPNPIARGLVRVSYTIGSVFSGIIPEKLQKKIDVNFEPLKPQREALDSPPAAFDMVRASVSLAVASMLISFATSLKLPLSTTYVTFMVAMGASLADKAWGRDSAVYRISGVVSVIGGWFMTAIIASTVAGVFAFLIIKFDLWAVAGITLLAIFSMIRSTMFHDKQEKTKKSQTKLLEMPYGLNEKKALKNIRFKVSDTLIAVVNSLSSTIEGLQSGNRAVLRQAEESIENVAKRNEILRFNLYHQIRKIDEHGTDVSKTFLKVYDNEEELLKALQFINKHCLQHVINLHTPLSEDQCKQLNMVLHDTNILLQESAGFIKQGIDLQTLGAIAARQELLMQSVDKLLDNQVQGIRDEVYGAKNSFLYFSVLMEIKDIAAVAHRFARIFQTMDEPEKEFTLTTSELETIL